ncbi:hypothetical protein BDD12DRAFT_819922 [Trichophaea hybrida]|nr:hypothetical protein BDD12DRAFT_819922 [Trichophaea hybrida]
MRSAVLLTILLSSLCTIVHCWSKEDHEIFRLRDELELNEGEGVTFYDFVGVKNGPAAVMDDINKAYRKTSARIHPDKFKPPKHLSRTQQATAKTKASERFARLGLIANILRGPERDRYDHFLKNGFPKWRGTGYYYARFRPGIESVLLGLYLVAGAAHYVVLKLNAKKQRQFMGDIIREVRQAAFGSAGVPGLAQALGEEDPAATGVKKQKKAKRDLGGSGNATPNRRKVVGPNGKSFIVDASGDVFLLDETEDGTQELLLDPSEVQDAKWRNTLLVGLPKGIWNITIGRFFRKKAAGDDEAEDWEAEEEGGANGNEAAAKKKKGVARKIERGGDGLPRRRAKGRAGKSHL